MSRFLVIDTSSSVCTVALVVEGRAAIRTLQGARSQGQFLLSIIKELTVEGGTSLDQLDALAVVNGPGSFTGIRIGIGVVQGLAMALDIPVVLLSSLEWIACSALAHYQCEMLLVCLTARDDEYYFGAFERTGPDAVKLLGREEVLSAGNITIPQAVFNSSSNKSVAVGNGWVDLDRFGGIVPDRLHAIDAEFQSDAESLCRLASQKLKLAEWVNAEQVLPCFLKENMDYKTAI